MILVGTVGSIGFFSFFFFYLNCRCDKNGDGKLSEDEVEEVRSKTI